MAPDDRATGDLFAGFEEPPPGPDPARRILVGTSGYSFADWVGPFYPRGLKPGDYLGWYARSFVAVEVNATYYAIPDPGTIERMERKTPAHFRFTVKLNQAMTHDRRLDAARVRPFLAAVAPLKAAGKYDGLLAQFPWGFRRTPANERHLTALRETFPDEPLFVEFRHASWSAPDVAERLRRERLGFVAVDEPALEGLMPPVTWLTTEDAYVRFHGRNAANWWVRGEGGGARPAAPAGDEASPGRGAATPGPPASRDRYDWDYSEAELGEWVQRVRDLADKARRTYLFFNNCHAGQAARSAKLMQTLLRQQDLPA
jgi:uncharacterized protein YecE (DUF72 family)